MEVYYGIFLSHFYTVSWLVVATCVCTNLEWDRIGFGTGSHGLWMGSDRLKTAFTGYRLDCYSISTIVCVCFQSDVH